MLKFFKRKRNWKQLKNLELEIKFVEKAMNVYKSILDEGHDDLNIVKDTTSRLADLELKLLDLSLQETTLLRKLY